MPNFTQIINQNQIIIGEEADLITSKDILFEALADKFLKTGVIQSQSDFIDALNYREKIGTTYMGNFIAIPHGESKTVTQSSLAVCKLNHPIKYESFGESGSIKYAFMFAIEKSEAGTKYLRMLAELASLLMNEDFLQKIESASSSGEIYNIFKMEGGK